MHQMVFDSFKTVLTMDATFRQNRSMYIGREAIAISDPSARRVSNNYKGQKRVSFPPSNLAIKVRIMKLLQKIPFLLVVHKSFVEDMPMWYHCQLLLPSCLPYRYL